MCGPFTSAPARPGEWQALLHATTHVSMAGKWRDQLVGSVIFSGRMCPRLVLLYSNMSAFAGAWQVNGRACWVSSRNKATVGQHIKKRQDPERHWVSRTAKSLTLALVSSYSRPVPGRALGLSRCRLLLRRRLLLLLCLLLQEHLLLEGRLVTSPLLPILACQGSSIPTSRPAATIAKACRQKISGSEQGI